MNGAFGMGSLKGSTLNRATRELEQANKSVLFPLQGYADTVDCTYLFGARAGGCNSLVATPLPRLERKTAFSGRLFRVA